MDPVTISINICIYPMNIYLNLHKMYSIPFVQVKIAWSFHRGILEKRSALNWERSRWFFLNLIFCDSVIAKDKLNILLLSVTYVGEETANSSSYISSSYSNLMPMDVKLF